MVAPSQPLRLQRRSSRLSGCSLCRSAIRSLGSDRARHAAGALLRRLAGAQPDRQCNRVRSARHPPRQRPVAGRSHGKQRTLATHAFLARRWTRLRPSGAGRQAIQMPPRAQLTPLHRKPPKPFASCRVSRWHRHALPATRARPAPAPSPRFATASRNAACQNVARTQLEALMPYVIRRSTDLEALGAGRLVGKAVGLPCRCALTSSRPTRRSCRRRSPCKRPSGDRSSLS